MAASTSDVVCYNKLTILRSLMISLQKILKTPLTEWKMKPLTFHLNPVTPGVLKILKMVKVAR